MRTSKVIKSVRRCSASRTFARDNSAGSSRSSGSSGSSKTTSSVSSAQQRAAVKKQRAEIKRQIAAYRKAANAWDACITAPGSAIPCGRPVKPPKLPDLPANPDRSQAGAGAGAGAGAAAAAAPAVPVVTNEQIAYAAFAQLDLVPPTPVIGPPPEINRWKMAAVGYPLWLAVDGDVTPAPQQSTAYDVSVALQARITRVVFDMGDGHTVRCINVTRPWTRAVKPGQKSPACGYAYQQPSLPDRTYTVTARTTWSVQWTVNGETGTIPLAQEASVQLPVGELQVLVR